MKTREPYEVSAADSALRFHVSSRSRPEIIHTVDLAAFTGNGSCSCEHFEFRILPLLRTGYRAADGVTRCSHIQAARATFLDRMIQHLSNLRNQTTTDDE